MFWIPIALIGFAVAYVIATYNGFVALRNRGRNAWADIDVQLKRRHDLVPNLVEIVKGYAGHERNVFENVTKLRSEAMQAQTPESRGQAENMLTSALKSLFAVAESYPQLKADENFRQLQSQVAEIEDQIQLSRRYYNAVVRDLNTKREMFPSNLIAGWFAIAQMEFFQIEDESEREPVKVDFS